MAASREGPNPLRPYYVPPSIGIPQGTNTTASSGPRPPTFKNGTAPTYASSARDIFSDIDYSDYVSESSQSTLDTVKGLLDQALYKYLSVLLAQPFENAKTILQVRDQSAGDGARTISASEEAQERRSQHKDSMYAEYGSDDSDPDELEYFTSTAPSFSSYSPSRSRRRHVTDRAGYVLPSSTSDPASHQLHLKRTDSIMEVLGQLWTKEGAWGVWKGSNATFVYSVLLKTTETWSRSLLAALVNVPDPGIIAGLGIGVDVVDSSYPWASLGVAVAAAAMASLILAPLDIVRTKLILTPTSNSKRSYIHNARILPSYICPPSLFIPTILHSIVSPIVTHTTPLLLRAGLGVDPIRTPSTFSMATFLSSTIELFLRLPIETVLRRGQVQLLSSPNYLGDGKLLNTVVNAGQYRGTVGTMWLIAREEGISVVPARPGQRGKKNESKGQGMEGLWRGWRVGMWGLVGVWGAAAMGGTAGSGEF